MRLLGVQTKGSATSSQGIRGYISVMAALKFTYFLSKGIKFSYNMNQQHALFTFNLFQ